MTVEFRCKKCGNLLKADADPGNRIRCDQCGRKVKIPAGAAALPDPQAQPGAEEAGQPPGAPDQEGEEQKHNAVMKVMAWIMPWVISVFLHLGLSLNTVFIVMIAGHGKARPEVFTPRHYLSETPGGRMSHDISRSKVQLKRAAPREEVVRTEAVTADSPTRKRSLIGLVGPSAGGVRFGPLGGGSTGEGPRSSLFGSGGNAYHVVYVIDRSGSMYDTFDFVRQEIYISISKLSENQDFHILMFSEGKAIENPPRKLVPGTLEFKEKAAKFLSTVVAEGQTDPVPALERAFEVLNAATDRRGKLIYILTDAHFPDNDRVLATVKKYNAKKMVSINTYLYGNRPEVAEKIMKQIAAENRGRYKYVSLD